MASVNKWIGIGNVCADPITRYMPNGDAVTNITVACNETWKDKDGKKQEKAEFVRVTFYRKLAEIAGEYLAKGRSVYIEGKLETRKWTDKSGVERYSTDIIASDMKMLGGKPSGEKEEKKFEGGAAVGGTSSRKYSSDFDEMDDDIPFIISDLHTTPSVVCKSFLRARRAS